MSRATAEDLERRILERLRASPAETWLKDVLVTQPDYDDDGAVVQVQVLVHNPRELSLTAARQLRDAIRAVVADSDDRMPSILFSEAA